MNRALTRSIAAFSALLLFSVAAIAQTYTIRLHHPEIVGSRYHLSATASESTEVNMLAGEKTVKTITSGFTLEFSADVTVLAINPAGWATRKLFVIGSSKLVEGETAGPLLPAGTTVLVSIENGETVYHVDGKLLADPITAHLKSVIDLHVAGVDDDELIGTTIPKAVGESWNINAVAVTKLMEELGARLDHARISGESSLENADATHISIRSSFRVTNAPMPLPGLTTESGDFETEILERVPLKSTDLSGNGTHRILIRMIGKGPSAANGAEIKFTMQVESGERYEVTPLRKH